MMSNGLLEMRNGTMIVQSSSGGNYGSTLRSSIYQQSAVRHTVLSLLVMHRENMDRVSRE